MTGRGAKLWRYLIVEFPSIASASQSRSQRQPEPKPEPKEAGARTPVSAKLPDLRYCPTNRCKCMMHRSACKEAILAPFRLPGGLDGRRVGGGGPECAGQLSGSLREVQEV